MKIRDLKIYFKFLSKNGFYTFVSIFGFSVSLMFVILLGVYTKQELTMDNFHEKKDRIYLMTHDYFPSFSNTIAPFVKENSPEVEAFCRMYRKSVFSKDVENNIIRTEALFADSTFFSIFTLELLEGIPTQVLTANRSVVITQNFANRVFGQEDVVGKTIDIDNWEHTITGIMKEFPNNTQFVESDIVVSYSSIENPQYFRKENILTSSDTYAFTNYFLAKEGADLPSKAALLFELLSEDQWYFKDGFAHGVEFIPLQDVYLKSNSNSDCVYKTNNIALTSVYIAIAILILVVATLNYINMTVAQSGFRGKEAAIKKLMGAERRSIVVQLLGESLLMTTITFGLGLLLAFIAEPYFNQLINNNIVLAEQFTLTNIIFVVISILTISFIAGLIPAMTISRFNPLEVVKGSFGKRVKSTYSRVLTVFQYVVAIVLLICAIFIQQQSNFLINYDLGYNKDYIFHFHIQIDAEQSEGLKNRLLSIPGVENISLSAGAPMKRPRFLMIPSDDGIQHRFDIQSVNDEFLEIYGIEADPIGAQLTESDVFVNRTLFNSSFVDQKEMIFNLGAKENHISGVFPDIHIGSLYTSEDRKIALFKITEATNPTDISIKISGASDVFAVADRVQKEYSDYNGGRPPEEPAFVDDTIEQWYIKEKNQSKIISAFAGLTIIISIMGVLAMSLYMIRQKKKEIGLRKINGATVWQIVAMLNKNAQLKILIAFIISTPIAYYAINKWLENFAYRISISWWVFVVAGVIVSLLTLITVSHMTWSAARVNPIDTLKSE